jgi:hypothetical protein
MANNDENRNSVVGLTVEGARMAREATGRNEAAAKKPHLRLVGPPKVRRRRGSHGSDRAPVRLVFSRDREKSALAVPRPLSFWRMLFVWLSSWRIEGERPRP